MHATLLYIMCDSYNTLYTFIYIDYLCSPYQPTISFHSSISPHLAITSSQRETSL